ncbi:MAG: class I SAM-dependent methyltransferase [Lachnospiraceae bacterium]|nr:class I SAM-dependent methyltransferase [Lachnospiraceae bacterium]
MSRQNIYDNDVFFQNFKSLREDEINFNDVIETPIILHMMPELTGKKVLDIGCGMGQHAKQYAGMGAASVLGIDISEKMLAFAEEHNSAENITYRRLAFEELEKIEDSFDVVTSSLAFDYVQDFAGLMKKIYGLLADGGRLVYSMSHPIATAYDGTYDRYTRTESGERLYANLRNYGEEGLRKIRWVVEGYELYHRKVSTLINDMIAAGFVIEECQESKLPPETIRQYPGKFGGVMHQPDFIFFRCRKQA